MCSYESFESNKIRLKDYYNRLKEINIILTKLNNELITFLKLKKKIYENRNKLDKINCMTREYIIPLYNKEKGLNKLDENKFKDDKKIIRNLSYVSCKLLNYILYIHLFFARLCTNSDYFDHYLPKGMTWFMTFKECFILFRKELEKKGIKRIELLMNVIFKELFTLSHEKAYIEKYDELIDFEDDLEKVIQHKIEKQKNKF